MKMTLMQHFKELRRRIVWVLIIFVFAFGVGFFIAPHLQGFLISPLLNILPDLEMLYTGLADGLFIQFSLATLFAILISIPVLMWHAWAFVSPGLKEKEKKLIIPMIILSPVLFIAGAAFAFYVLFPMAFNFFIEINKAAIVPTILLPVTRDYLSFTIGLLKIFGIAFQLPLILFVLNRIGVLPRTAVIKFRKYAIVGIFVLAAILTPPDVISQCVLALPVWLLFEISILFMKKE